MTEKTINPVLKQVLEMGPVLGFFVAFFLLKEDTYQLFGNAVEPFTFITFWFVVGLVICMGILLLLVGQLSRVQIMTLVLVVVMGGLTVFLDNDLFLKLKPTILYAAFAAVLWVGLLQGKSYIASLMDGMVPMTDEGWLIMTRRFLAFFVFLAVANAVIAFTLSSGAWLTVKTFGLPVALLVFVVVQFSLLQDHMIDTEDTASDD